MKRFTLVSFLLTILSLGVFGQLTDLERRQIEDFRNPNAKTIAYEKKAKIKNAEVKIFDESNFVKMMPMFKNDVSSSVDLSKAVDELNPSSKIENVFNWGTARYVEDDKQISFSQKNERSHNYYYTPFYKSATFEFLDEQKNATKTIKLTVPDTTMSISVMGQFSKTIFNSDTKTEFMVQAHGFSGHGQGPASCRDTVYIINEDGKILKRFGNASGARIIFDNKTSPVTRKLLVYHVYYSGIQTEQRVDVYDARTLVLQKTISTPNNLLSYSSGPFIDYLRINNVPYFYTAHYEKPFIANGDQMNPIVEMNNKYVIKLLNPTTYEVAKEFKLNLIGQEDNQWSMVSHGFFSSNMKYDLSTNIFNDDDGFEILYGMDRYIIDCDCERIDYYVVNEQNEIIKTLPPELDYAWKISDVVGESEQWALLPAGGVAIKFVDLPSFEEIYTFDAVYEGELLSINFDRVPAKKGGYNWVIQLGRGEDGGNTWYGGIAYYDKIGKMVKRDRIDLGPRAARFNPVISSQMVSPYWADTDEGNEYAYFASFYNANDQVESYFGVSDDDMTTPYRWSVNEYGTMSGAGVTVFDTGDLKELYVSFRPNPTGDPLQERNANTSLFYKLPFKSFTSGGTGTLDDPYLITNPGELNQVRNNLESNFVLANDIDLAGYTASDGKGWLPIGGTTNMFKGSLDGQNHIIKNMYIDRAGSAVGLFDYISLSTIKNLTFKDLNIVDGTVIGAVTANCQGGLIENCHVYGNINGTGDIGGVVGKGTNNTIIKICSFEGNLVSTGGAVGGITSSAMTNSKVFTSFSKGTITAKNSSGGIVGSTRSDGYVKNSYSTCNVTTQSDGGGLVGASQGKIENGYATGTIYAGGWQFSRGAGSISGSAFKGMVGDAFVRNVVGFSEKVTAPDLYGRIIGEASTTLDLTNAYAISTMKVGVEGSETTVTSTDATSANGASKTLAEMDQAFYEGIGWAFGNDSISPWRMSNGYPRLWYEFIVRSVSLNENKLVIDMGSTYKLVATILPATAENKGLFWESSDNKVVKVDQNGVVTPMGKGTATITVTTDDGDYAATCEFTVNVPVTSIALDRTDLKLNKGEKISLVATVNPDNANNKNVEWSSSNQAIATVSTTGEVVAVKPGNATITVRTVDGGFTATCNVVVVILPNKIILNETEINIKKTETFQLEATVRPADATNKAVTWSSSNNNIVTVSQTGLVTGIDNGEATITVTTVEGGITATCLVTVGILPNEIVLNKTDIKIEKTHTFQLEATVYPADATNKTVTWSSSNAAIATVSENGLVTGIEKGRAIVTVTTVEGGITATCEVEVDFVSVNDLSTENINIFYYNNRINIDTDVQINTIQIRDISGRIIYDGQEMTISTTSWSNGVYIVKVIDVNNNVITSKVSIH